MTVWVRTRMQKTLYAVGQTAFCGQHEDRRLQQTVFAVGIYSCSNYPNCNILMLVL